MDKNQTIGMVLIMALLFGFMWLTPKESPEAGADDDIAQAIPQTAARVDSLSATEHEWLVKNIIEHGETVVLADSTHAARLNDGAINLTVAGDSVTGTVTVDGKTLSWRDVCRADLKKMTVKEQQKAVEAVRNASLSMGRYGKFAKFLTGSDSVVRLENDVLKLELSSKSGSVTRAQLKNMTRNTLPTRARSARRMWLYSRTAQTQCRFSFRSLRV